MMIKTKNMAATIIAIALYFLSSPAMAQVQGIELDKPELIPTFILSDKAGNTFTDQDLKDQWTILMFGFNSCPDVCPFTLGNLEAAIAETAVRVRPDSVPQVVYISVDPARDRDVVSDYAKYFHPDFLGVTGEQAQIDVLINATDSFYRFMPAKADGSYEVQHSAAVSVVGPDGMLRAKLQPPFDPGKTAEFLARQQIKFRRSALR